MKYTRYAPEETKKLGNLWLGGHTDLGAWTLLFCQPVAGLQIKNHTTGEWKWVKPYDGMLTVNAGDALSFMTGGYVKSTIHRCVSAHYYSQSHCRICSWPRLTASLCHRRISSTSTALVSITSPGTLSMYATSLRPPLTDAVACSTNSDVKLSTIAVSPVLEREGYTQNEFEKSGNAVPTMEGAIYLSPVSSWTCIDVGAR